MMDDDKPTGQVLSRREAFAILGASGAAFLAGARGAVAQPTGRQIPSCVVRPAQTAGPYFVDERLDRADIRSDPTSGAVKAGAPLALAIMVSQLGANSCRPVAGALVDLWQCDADGVYAGVQDRSFDTRGQKFLRGYQLTDASGTARFTTIYPGWYQGRTVHLHFKIRLDPAAARGREFTSQLYFDDGLTDRVHADPPYARAGRRTRNMDDRIYRSGGDQLMLSLEPSAGGYAGSFAVGLQT